MTNLSVYLGKTKLSSCITNASGPKCTTSEELTNLDNSESGYVLTKSSTLHEREGNPKPRYYDNILGSINSMGLPNLGHNFYIEESRNIKNKPYIISVCGLTLDDTLNILNNIFQSVKEQNYKIAGVEINLSCPNIIGKGQLGYDFNKMDQYLKTIFDLDIIKHLPNFIIGVKLPPYFDLHQFGEVTDILEKYRIDFVTCINSIGNGLIIDSEKEEILIKPKGGMGGIGGKYVKPTGLSNVRNFYLQFKKRNLKIDIIGCGGIENGEDVFDYILCGATLVQVGTQFYKEGCELFYRLNTELLKIMKKKNYKNLEDFRGKLKTI